MRAKAPTCMKDVLDRKVYPSDTAWLKAALSIAIGNYRAVSDHLGLVLEERDAADRELGKVQEAASELRAELADAKGLARDYRDTCNHLKSIETARVEDKEKLARALGYIDRVNEEENRRYQNDSRAGDYGNGYKRGPQIGG